MAPSDEVDLVQAARLARCIPCPWCPARVGEACDTTYGGKSTLRPTPIQKRFWEHGVHYCRWHKARYEDHSAGLALLRAVIEATQRP